MAFMSQENKKELAPAIKAALKKYGVKASIAVHNHSTLVVNIKSSKIDFIGNFNAVKDNSGKPEHLADTYIDVNPYWYEQHFTGEAVEFLKELFTAMNNGNYNDSDIMTDYFNVGWYTDVNIGQWDKPFIFEEA